MGDYREKLTPKLTPTPYVYRLYYREPAAEKVDARNGCAGHFSHLGIPTSTEFDPSRIGNRTTGPCQTFNLNPGGSELTFGTQARGAVARFCARRIDPGVRALADNGSWSLSP